jgi:hypothetical protein
MIRYVTLRARNLAQKLILYKELNNGTAALRGKFTSTEGCKKRG